MLGLHDYALDSVVHESRDVRIIRATCLSSGEHVVIKSPCADRPSPRTVGRILHEHHILRHDVTVTGQMKFPTAPVTYDRSGEALASNLQPGCSSVVPGVTGAYGLAWSIVSLSFSAGLLLPIVVREAPHRGVMIRQTTTLRVRPAAALAFTAGFTWLGELIGQDETDANEEDSGGLVGYVSAAIEAGKPGVLVASVGLDAPVVKALRGEQSPTVIGMARLSVGWDI